MRVSWQSLYDEIYACEKCELCRQIHNKVPGQGDGNADLMFIGEGPGAEEDLQGLAVFLASPASDFINGQVVYIDGGILAYIGQDPSQLDESKFAVVQEKEHVNVVDK